jgi:hypothetical protein
MWCLKTSLHTIKVMSCPKELRKDTLSIVHITMLFFLLLPMKENELPNCPHQKAYGVPALTNTQLVQFNFRKHRPFHKYTEKKLNTCKRKNWTLAW